MLTSPDLSTDELATLDERWFEEWRARELARLDRAGLTYLDYTGASPHPASLVAGELERLDQRVLGNPHSEHQPSRSATEDIESARAAILDFLSADPGEYAVVLTANATAACHLVAESYPWSHRCRLVLTADNHNSVNGIAEYAQRAGSPVDRIPLGDHLALEQADAALGSMRGPGLFAYPAQSNFSGSRHPISLVDTAHASGLDVLLDAAAYLPTADLDLRAVKPAFVVLSLYKIIGYPAGLGALVARRDALARLKRPWFSGGTVDWVSPSLGRHQLRPGVEAFEDGTPPFLIAGAVAPGLAIAREADRPRLRRHLGRLTKRLLDGLADLRLADGRPLVLIHGAPTPADRGATVSMTVLDGQGRAIPFWEVESAARSEGLAIRGGCFCNPGCAEKAFELTPATIGPCLDTLGGEFSIPGFVTCLGDRPVGAVRVSLGLGSLHRDVDRALAFLGTVAGR